jgi:hypothetical protein
MTAFSSPTVILHNATGIDPPENPHVLAEFGEKIRNRALPDYIAWLGQAQ